MLEPGRLPSTAFNEMVAPVSWNKPPLRNRPPPWPVLAAPAAPLGRVALPWTTGRAAPPAPPSQPPMVSGGSGAPPWRRAPPPPAVTRLEEAVALPLARTITLLTNSPPPWPLPPRPPAPPAPPRKVFRLREPAVPPRPPAAPT